MRMGKMLYSESSKKTEKNAPSPHQVFKRPHGVAILNLMEMVSNKEYDSEEKEFTLKVRPEQVIYLLYITCILYTNTTYVMW